MPVKLLICLGTYEKTLHGIDLKLSEENGKTVLGKKVSFSISAHIGCIKAIAAGPHYLVSGSTDETIRIFDLKRRKDYGSLTCHSGSISCLSYHRQKMLFSGGEDGKITMTRCADWETIMTLRGHTGGVRSVAVHPSGKLALSCGRDRTAKAWNLVTGKIALKVKLQHQVDRIIWSPRGTYYAYLSERHVQVFRTEGANCILEHDSNKKVLCGVFSSDSKLVIAGEGSELSIYDLNSEGWSTISTDHKPRIKDIQCTEAAGFSYLATGSSDGLCCLWIVEDGGLALIASEKSNLRITCLALAAQ